MGTRFYLWVLVFLMGASCTTLNPISAQFDDQNFPIKGAFKMLKLDKLGNIYLLDHQNQLFKYDDNGNELFNFNNKRYGNLTHLDVSNPQKVLLFYSDFQTVVLLDNTLSVFEQFFLEELGFWNTQAVALSNDNLIWLFDQVQKKLIKMDRKGSIVLESNTIVDESLSTYPIIEMIEKDNKVYLNANSNGVIVFDNLGSYLNTIIDVKPKHLQILNKKIFYCDSTGDLFYYADVIEGPQSLVFDSADKKLLDFHIERGDIYVLYEEGVIRKTLFK